MTGHQHTEDATTPQPDLASIHSRLAARTPAQRTARQVRHDSHAIGLAAMRLGEEHMTRGDLDTAHDWFALAVEHHALDATTMLGRVTALREATDSPVLFRAAAGTSLAENPLSHGERDLTLRRLETGADLILDAHNTAARVLTDARREAERVIADASTTAQDILDTARQAARDTRTTARHEAERILATARTTARRADLTTALPVDHSTMTGSVRGLDIDSDLTMTVTAAVSGDRKAIERLLATVRPLVIRYCRARIGRQESSFASADDAAQQVCLAVLTSLPTYRDQGGPFLAFVYGIAAHKVTAAHRTAARKRSKPAASSAEAGVGSEQQALRGELSREMTTLLKALPAQQREILLLRVVVGLSAEETATALGSTPEAVRVAQHRALTTLRKTMTNEPKAPEPSVTAVPVTREPATPKSVEQPAPPMALLTALPEKQQQVVMLREHFGLSTKETASRVGSTPGAVRSAQYRAMKRLRETAFAVQMA